MKETRIIGLSGEQEVGKSTLAHRLMNFNNYAISRNAPEYMYWGIDSFADPLYKMSSIVAGIPVNERIDKNKLYKVSDNKEMTGREILQTLGTECIRNNISYDFFVYSLKQRAVESKFGVILVEDNRFENERNILDFSIYVEVTDNLKREQKNNHKSEEYLKVLKERANLIITRGPKPEQYSMFVGDIWTKIKSYLRSIN